MIVFAMDGYFPHASSNFFTVTALQFILILVQALDAFLICIMDFQNIYFLLLTLLICTCSQICISPISIILFLVPASAATLLRTRDPQ